MVQHTAFLPCTAGWCSPWPPWLPVLKALPLSLCTSAPSWLSLLLLLRSRLRDLRTMLSLRADQSVAGSGHAVEVLCDLIDGLLRSVGRGAGGGVRGGGGKDCEKRV